MHSDPNSDFSKDAAEMAAQMDAEASRLTAVEAELAAAKSENLRLLAEMDNQRKRMHRDIEAARKYAAERLLSDLLPVLDGLDMGLKVESSDASKLRAGMDLTLKMLGKALEQHGLSVVDPLGETFSPEAHQAMNSVPNSEHPAGTILQVFQKGYRLNDRLLRPAMVAVSAVDA